MKDRNLSHVIRKTG